MAFDVRWDHAVNLEEGYNNLIYGCDQDAFPEEPGVYVFARRWGKGLVPVYVGEAQDLRKRIPQHFTSDVQLMNAIRLGKTGQRVVLAGVFRPAQGQGGQRLKSNLRIIEGALIKAALAEGFTLFQKKGTKRKTHDIELAGSKAGRDLFGPHVYAEKS